MISVTCQCGVHYQVPEQMAGRKARCRKCGGPIPVPAQAPPDDDDVDVIPLADEPLAIRGTAVSRPAAAAAGPGVAAGPPADAGGNFPLYLKDCMSSLLFIAHPDNVLPFLMVAAIASLKPLLGFAGCIGTIALFTVNGWIYSFLFNVVLNAASGERDLPELTLTDGLADTVLIPMLKFLGSAAIAFLPLIIYVFVRGPGVVTLENADPGFLLLTLAGALVWPMVILVIAVGGVAALGRPDLIASTVGRTMGPYLITCLLCAGAMAASAFVMVAAVSTTTRHPILLMAGLEVLQLYVSVVAMRFIGLYYHHFKKRFAWSWG